MVEEKKGEYKILFVCLGNICRSPSAEAVMKKLVQDAGLDGRIKIDSAGIIGYHAGEKADPRMRSHAARRGYKLDSVSRPVCTEDFFDFVHIPADTRSAFPVISVQSPVSIQYRWQS